MQPHSFLNEIEHWRKTAERPPPSPRNDEMSSSDLQMNRSFPFASNEGPFKEKDGSSGKPAKADSSRGWLEYTPVQVSPSYSADSRIPAVGASSGNKRRAHGLSRNSQLTSIDSQKAKDMLGVVSNEDILKLTQLTSQLSEPSRNTKLHHRREESRNHRRNWSSSHSRNVSAATDDNMPKNGPLDMNIEQMHDTSPPVYTRPSVSTPPLSRPVETPLRRRRDFPSNVDNATKQERRRSWYKQLIKRDKGKLKGKVSMDSVDVRDSIATKAGSPENSFSVGQSPGSSIMARESSRSSGGSDQRRVLITSPLNVSPNIPAAAQPQEKQSKRSSLHPSSFIKGKSLLHRRTSSAAVTLSHDTFANETPVQRPPLENNLRNRHSFDGLHDSNVTSCSKVPSSRDRRRSSVDIGAITDTRRESQLSPLKTISTQQSMEARLCDPRPSFDLFQHTKSIETTGDGSVAASDDGIKSNIASGIAEDNEPAASNDSGVSESSNEDKDDTVQLMFDYDTLPDEVIGLLKEYEKMGRLEIRESAVNSNRRTDMQAEHEDGDGQDDEEEEEEGEEDEDDEAFIDPSKLIAGVRDILGTNAADQVDDDSRVRRIAIVQASKNDTAEFVKLIHLAEDDALTSGPLVDLHVSLLGDQNDSHEDQEDVHTLLREVDTRIVELETLTKESRSFMDKNSETIDNLALDELENCGGASRLSSSHQGSSSSNRKNLYRAVDDTVIELIDDKLNPTRPSFLLDTPPVSSSSISSSSSSSGNALPSTINATPSPHKPDSSPRRYSYSSIHHTPSLLFDTFLPYRSFNPFDYRQEEVRIGVCTLQNEIGDFKRALSETEKLIRDIQNDIDDTRQRMALYLKDIPETHYSALKKLEVDIESILANRAKNPWHDTGYALLSYLLTLFALLVWVIICTLKWIRTVVTFPRKLWQTYSEYLVERDKAVKRASIHSVASGTNLTSASRLKQRPISRRE